MPDDSPTGIDSMIWIRPTVPAPVSPPDLPLVPAPAAADAVSAEIALLSALPERQRELSLIEGQLLRLKDSIGGTALHTQAIQFHILRNGNSTPPLNFPIKVEFLVDPPAALPDINKDWLKRTKDGTISDDNVFFKTMTTPFCGTLTFSVTAKATEGMLVQGATVLRTANQVFFFSISGDAIPAQHIADKLLQPLLPPVPPAPVPQAAQEQQSTPGS